MRTVKNNPGKYVKRCDLVGPRRYASGSSTKREQVLESRDFAAAEIDRNFYVIFRAVQRAHKPK